MAFQSATGWGNLPNGSFSPVIYSKNVQTQFRKESVCSDITNSDYFGEIANFGDSVRIIKEPEITVRPYARGTQIESQDIVDEDFSLVIDRSNYFAFQVDDIEERHSHVNYKTLAQDRAAYRLKDKYDMDILGYMGGYEYNDSTGVWTARTAAVGTKAEATADADELIAAHKMDRGDFGGAAGDSIALKANSAGTGDATPLQVLNRMNTFLDRKNVDKDGRWVVVDPVFLERLMDEDSKFMNQDYSSSENLTNGMITAGKVRGFRLYMSNNLPVLGTGPDTVDANGSAVNFGVIIAGHDSSTATAEQISKTEVLRSQDSFGDTVRGMHLYGRKILRPEGLVRATYNVAT